MSEDQEYRDRWAAIIYSKNPYSNSELLGFNSYMNKADLLTRILRSGLHYKIEEHIERLDLTNKDDLAFAVRLLEVEAKLVPKESKFDGKIETTDRTKELQGKSVDELRDRFAQLECEVREDLDHRAKVLKAGERAKISDAKFEVVEKVADGN